MKANQKFMEADDAVSPVIGVILMVAITVVLAAVVFVLVSDLGGGGGETQPAISWSVSQADASASVTSAEPGAQWSEFEMRIANMADLGAAVTDVTATLDGTAVTFAAADGAAYQQLDAWPAIGGGDTILFACVGGAAGTAGPLEVTLRHIDSNSVAREFSFTSVDDCANAA